MTNNDRPRPTEREEVDRKVLITSEAAARMGERNDRANRRFLQVAVLAGVLVLALVVTFGLISISQQDRSYRAQGHQQTREHDQTVQILNQDLLILKNVQAATNPDSPYSKQADAAAQALIDRVVNCLETHGDQTAAVEKHRPVPATPKGCPADPHLIADP